jgi:hypothetical protein
MPVLVVRLDVAVVELISLWAPQCLNFIHLTAENGISILKWLKSEGMNLD